MALSEQQPKPCKIKQSVITLKKQMGIIFSGLKLKQTNFLLKCNSHLLKDSKCISSTKSLLVLDQE
jgi:hypothetical protein